MRREAQTAQSTALSLRGLRWRLLSEELKLPLFERLLKGRQIGSLQSFLAPSLKDLPDPSRFLQMEAALQLIARAKRDSQKVLIYGDYDVDGVSGSVILYQLLASEGLKPLVYLPERLQEGYGLNLAVLKRFVAEGVKLLITVDTGISYREEIQFLKSRSVAVVIIDHHLPPRLLPPADAILNPKVKGEKYPFKELSSSGISWQLARALAGQRAALAYLDLAVLGTVTDMVPLTGDNRVITKFGLEAFKTSPRPGIQALRRVLGFEDSEVDTRLIGFMIGPRLNAAGRMKHAQLAFDLLNSDDILEAYELASELSVLNTKRQEVTEKTFREALVEAGRQLDKKIIVVESSNWSIGVAGIVANRLTEAFSRPAIVLEQQGNLLKGSARSVSGVNVAELIAATSRYLESFGGHAQAAGLAVKADNYLPFKRALWQAAEQKIHASLLLPTLAIDSLIQPSEINLANQLEIGQLEPFGLGNEEPNFLWRGATIKDVQSINGLRGPHLKLFLAELPGVPAYWFGQGELASLMQNGRFDLALRLGHSHFNGHPLLRLKLQDARASV